MHLVLIKGSISANESVLVRVHEPLSVFDLLDASSRNHSWSLPDAMKLICEVGNGVIIMFRREEKDAELIKSINSADHSVTNKHILKDYGIGAQILRELGVVKMRLMGEQRKIPSMTGFGLEVTEFLAGATMIKDLKS